MKTPLTFTAAGPVYGFAPGVKAGDIVDQLNARQIQLEALLEMTYGETGEALRRLSDGIQDNYMWACSMIAGEIRDLTKAVQERQAAEEVTIKAVEKHSSRLTLPFVVPDEPRGGIASHWSVPHDPNALYSEGVAVGRRHLEAVASLAESDEEQAALALSLAMNSSGWHIGGWGIEAGFSKALAEAAIVGLRAMRAGAAAGIGVDQADGNEALNDCGFLTVGVLADDSPAGVACGRATDALAAALGKAAGRAAS